MAKFLKGLKWGVIIGATAAVLSDEKKRRDIAGKLKKLQAEVERQTEIYKKNWPKYQRTAKAEAKKWLEQAARLQKELEKKSKVYEKEGEKVKARVVTETQAVVREAGKLLDHFTRTANSTKNTAKTAVKKTVKSVKKSVKKAAPKKKAVKRKKRK